jgi:hypothetical protein
MLPNAAKMLVNFFLTYIDLKDVITKVEVKLEIETKSTIGIDTPLDIVSIASRDRRRETF